MRFTAIPSNDATLRTWVLEFEEALLMLPDKKRPSQEQLDRLRKEIEEFQVAHEKHVAARDVLADLARDKEIKRAPLTNTIRELMEVSKWDKKAEQRKKVVKNYVHPADKQSAKPVDWGAPALKLDAAPGKVTIAFGRIPEFATGVCIYRKRVGDARFEMRHYAQKGPYIDEVKGEPDVYEYMGRYWLKCPSELAGPGEVVRIKAGE